ncbi:chitinase-3-like protein 1 [Dermacentor andersoni]|uniref:chitinase-3-like protein 1 n=1 Tax=Dermacentor andersoni TaxID=34620 RepID=UPI0021552C13|nr:probable chitinase 10 [Dermacentor andersoni]
MSSVALRGYEPCFEATTTMDVCYANLDKKPTVPSSRKLLQTAKTSRRAARSKEGAAPPQQHRRMYYVWFFANMAWAVLAFPLGVGAISLARNYQMYRDQKDHVLEWKTRWAQTTKPAPAFRHAWSGVASRSTRASDVPYRESKECRKPRVLPESPWKPPFTDPIEDYPAADPVDGPIICVFNHSSYRRDKERAFRTGLVNGRLCTHVVYASAKVTGDDLTSADPGFDLVKEGFKNLALLKTKYPHLKVLVSFGEYERGSANLSSLASSAVRRSKFAQNVLSWLIENDYDGVHVHWTIADAGRCGSLHDATRLAKLVAKLRSTLTRNYTIVLTIPPFKTQRNGYALDDLVANVDYFVVRTHDIHGPDANATHCASPYTSSGPSLTKALVGVVEDLPPYTTQKICFSLSFAAVSLQLGNKASANRNSAPAKVLGPGIEGNFTRTRGRMAFYEVCALGDSGAFLDFKEICSYREISKNWIGYESPTSLSSKLSEIFRKLKIYCVALWDIDMDDTKGTCGLGRTPLLASVHKELVTASSHNRATSVSAQEAP